METLIYSELLHKFFARFLLMMRATTFSKTPGLLAGEAKKQEVFLSCCLTWCRLDLWIQDARQSHKAEKMWQV